MDVLLVCTLSTGKVHGGQKKGIEPYGTRVTDGCEPSYMY